MADLVLARLSPRFSRLYGRIGRPSIPPEKLLRAVLLQVFYTIRSERMLMEQLDYNLLFHWFVGLNMDDPVWDVPVFTKNRQRLLKGHIAQIFFEKVLEQARELDLLSNEHFTVDGTLLEAWASLKSFKRVDGPQPPPDDPGNPTVDFHGEKRSNATHVSTTAPEALLAKKGAGREAKLSYTGHALMENRSGLVVDTEVTQAYGTAALMAERIAGDHRVTLGADKNYDTAACVADLRSLNVTPHIAQNNRRRKSALDARTTRHAGYLLSQRKRKRVEEICGWMKTVGGLRKLHHRGLELVKWMFRFAAAAYNLVRIRNLATAIG